MKALREIERQIYKEEYVYDPTDGKNLVNAVLSIVGSNFLQFMIATKFKYKNLKTVVENFEEKHNIENYTMTTKELLSLYTVDTIKINGGKVPTIDKLFGSFIKTLNNKYVMLFESFQPIWHTENIFKFLVPRKANSSTKKKAIKKNASVSTPLALIDDILSHMTFSADQKIVDPCCGNGTFLYKIKQLLNNDNTNVFGFDIDLKKCYITNALLNPFDDTRSNIMCLNFLDMDNEMKFDVIVGNPPFQDGSKSGQQNKIYNQFCKKSLGMVTSNGVVSLVTPTSVLKVSKRFSLIGNKGLKTVNFLANDHFDVGVNICYWIVDNKHNESVEVIHKNGLESVTCENPIYDYSEHDKDFIKLYSVLKKVCNEPSKRMFARNNIGPARCNNKTDMYKYPLYKFSGEISYYIKKKPYYHSDLKLVICFTKSFNENAIQVTTMDVEETSVCVDINNDQEVENIKSFLLSPYFIEHCKKWRNLDGYGFNYAVKYLPPFDKTKHWTNDEVKDFIEGFLTDQ